MEELTINSISAKAESSPSAQTVASILDLLTKILLLLPIRSLIRFKTVSKHWLALLSNPTFCHLRSRRRNPAAGLFLPCSDNHQCYDYIPFGPQSSKHPSFSKLEFGDGIRILQSCNGLLLCCSAPAFNPSYYVYNPTTNNLCVLPTLGISRRISGMNLAFDPVKSRYYYVICVCLLEMEGISSPFLIEIYSSETGFWKLCGDPFMGLVNFENGVYWNGGIHWMGIGNGDSLYFDIDRHMLGRMPELPLRYGWNSRGNYYFGESCDHLHFTEMRCPAVQFSIFEMKRDYSEWFVKYQVDLSPVIAANPDMILGRINPVGWYSFRFSIFTIIHGEEEDSFFVLHTPSKALRYNLVNKTYENLYEFEFAADNGSHPLRMRYPGISGFQYIESLCCV